MLDMIEGDHGDTPSLNQMAIGLRKKAWRVVLGRRDLQATSSHANGLGPRKLEALSFYVIKPWKKCP
jgi:hypothetical protein